MCIAVNSSLDSASSQQKAIGCSVFIYAWEGHQSTISHSQSEGHSVINRSKNIWLVCIILLKKSTRTEVYLCCALERQSPQCRSFNVGFHVLGEFGFSVARFPSTNFCAYFRSYFPYRISESFYFSLSLRFFSETLL